MLDCSACHEYLMVIWEGVYLYYDNLSFVMHNITGQLQKCHMIFPHFIGGICNDNISEGLFTRHYDSSCMIDHTDFAANSLRQVTGMLSSVP
jgi:hypothetical protein